MNASPLQAIKESGPMDDNCPAARIGELGNQVHNLGCDYQNDEDLSDELGQVAVTLWDLAEKVASLDQAQREREDVISSASAVVDTTDLNRTIDDSFILRVAIDRLYDAGMLRRAGE